MEFYTILTQVGANKQALAIANNTPLNLKDVALGDGNGSVPSPNAGATGLVNEVFRTQISELKVDPLNDNYLIATGVVPIAEGNFWIREFALFDEAGDCFAIGNMPETYKPLLSEGAGKEIEIRFIMELSNTDSVVLQIDPSVVMASQEFVNQELTKYAKINGDALKIFKAKDAVSDEDVVNKKTLDVAIQTTGLPVGTHYIQSRDPFANEIIELGGEFLRVDEPELWSWIQTQTALLKTEAQWQTESLANEGICGFFSNGDGSTTFRVRKLDGITMKAVDETNRLKGSFENDAIRNIVGTASTWMADHAVFEVASGAFSLKDSGAGGNISSGSGTRYRTFELDASRVVPTANENRIKNIGGLPLIVARKGN